jgi:hypothetical protein
MDVRHVLDKIHVLRQLLGIIFKMHSIYSTAGFILVENNALDVQKLLHNALHAKMDIF